MASPAKRPLFSLLTSKRLTLFLLGALALVLIPATVSTSWLYMAAGRLLLAALALNLTLCTIRHWRRLSRAVILIHSGVLTILLGSLVSRAGFVATVNIYEGGTSATAFRWDRQADTPLGFALTVNQIHHDYYPVSVRVGVLTANQPPRLYELKTGEGFRHEGVQVEALAFDPLPPALHLALTGGDGVRVLQTVTKETPAQHAGLTLQLVAFQTPVLKRSWVDLTLLPAATAPVSGQAAVNYPLRWQGLRVYHTATNVDPLGRSYAGLQIVDDQGIPLVYLGCALLFFGNGWLLLDSMRRGRGGSSRAAWPDQIGSSRP